MFVAGLNTVNPLYINLQVANFQRCKCTPICQLYCATVLFKVLYYKIKMFSSFLCVLCIICVKCIINLLQYSSI